METPEQSIVHRLRDHAGTLRGPQNDDMRQAADIIEQAKPSWDFACAWYSTEEIQGAIKNHWREGMEKIPEDIHSSDFAEWLTHQCRLAMAKGIEIGRRQVAQDNQS